MNPIYGTVIADDISAEQGLRRRLRIPMTVKNTNDGAVDVTALTTRVYIDFSDEGRAVSGGIGQYLSEAFPETIPSTFFQGDQNRVTLLAPIEDTDLFAIESARAQRDVRLHIEAFVVATERPRSGVVTVAQTATMPITDGRAQSNQYIVTTIAKSSWSALLSRLGYSPPTIDPQELRRLIDEARSAKEQAESAAKGAKEAAALTAVTSLAQAYSEECRVLKRRSIIWAAISLVVASLGAWLMFIYARESLHSALSVSATILRSVIIAAVFGVLALCLRVYESYLHLEVVNRHRVNVGRTFEAFKAAQPTERAREIMSAITAEHMLAFGKSGFAPKDSPNQGPFPALTELIRTLAEKK